MLEVSVLPLLLSLTLGQFGPITTFGVQTTGTEVADAGNYATLCLLGSCITSWPSSSSSSGGGGNQYFLDGGFHATSVTVAPTGTTFPFSMESGLNAIAAGIDSIGADDGGNVFVTLGNGQSFIIWNDAGVQVMNVNNQATTSPLITMNAIVQVGSTFGVTERYDDAFRSTRFPLNWGSDSAGNWYWMGGSGTFGFYGDGGGAVLFDRFGNLEANNIDAGGNVQVGGYILEGWGYPWLVTLTSNTPPQDAGIDVIGSDTSGNLYETLGTGAKAEWWNDGGALVASINYLGNADFLTIDAGAIWAATTILADGGIQGQVLTAGNLQADYRTYPLQPGAVYADEYHFYEPNGYDYAQFSYEYSGYTQIFDFTNGAEYMSALVPGLWLIGGLTGQQTAIEDPQLVASHNGFSASTSFTASLDVVSEAGGAGANGLNIMGQQTFYSATENTIDPVFVGNLGNDAGFTGLWFMLTSSDAGPNNATMISDGGWLTIDQTGVPVTIGGPVTVGTIDAGRYVNPAPEMLVTASSPTFAENTIIAASGLPPNFVPTVVGFSGYVKSAGAGSQIVTVQVSDTGGHTCYAGLPCSTAGAFSIFTSLDGTCALNTTDKYSLAFGPIDGGTACTTNPTYGNINVFAQVVHN